MYGLIKLKASEVMEIGIFMLCMLCGTKYVFYFLESTLALLIKILTACTLSAEISRNENYPRAIFSQEYNDVV